MYRENQALSVSSADFVRSFGRWQDRVAASPVFVTHHGRDRLVALSVETYRALLNDERPDAATQVGPDVRLDTVIARIGQGFIAFDQALRVTEINPVACAYLRAARAALIGSDLAGGHPDFARSLAHSHLARAARSGEVATFDAPSLAYTGHWLHFQTFPYGTGAACLFRNITEEMENRQRACTKAAILAAMAQHGALGFARLSPRATFTQVDATLAAMAGFERDSLLHVRLTDILPIGKRVEAAGMIEAVLTSGTPQAFDTALLVNNGGELPVRLALAGLRGEIASDGAIVLVTRV